jgi:hypothetical protein
MKQTWFLYTLIIQRATPDMETTRILEEVH